MGSSSVLSKIDIMDVTKMHILVRNRKYKKILINKRW